MELWINDKKEQTEAVNLAQLMIEKGLSDKKAIALAVNDEVVPKREWELTPLVTSDRILIIHPTQGG